jgi:hypothetical protein
LTIYLPLYLFRRFLGKFKKSSPERNQDLGIRKAFPIQNPKFPRGFLKNTINFA